MHTVTVLNSESDYESIVDIYNFLILLPIHSMSFAHNQHLSVLEFFH